MVTKSIEMKHKDHVRKTQLDWAFCIQNFLDATLALEFLLIVDTSFCNPSDLWEARPNSNLSDLWEARPNFNPLDF